jgi:hypothetical protein
VLRIITQWSLLAALLLLAVPSGVCQSVLPRERLLFDFEDDADLDRLQWRCFTLYSLSDRHATRGDKSLRLDLYPSAYPGLVVELGGKDWSAYRALKIDLYHGGQSPLQMHWRIDDKKMFPPLGDRFGQRVDINPGASTLSIEFKELLTTETQRPIYTSSVFRFMLFSEALNVRQTLYIDNIRLITKSPS